MIPDNENKNEGFSIINENEYEDDDEENQGDIM